MKKTSLLLIAANIILLPCVSLAWGKEGHFITAEIAFSLLDSNTQQSVRKYLDTTSIEEASVWMDEICRDHSYDYMKPWHYVDFEKGKEYVATNDANLVNALNNAIYLLEHKSTLSDSAIKRNLLIVFHLTGDLHQPLHIGYSTDRGGNDIKVTYFDHPSNLHRVWDTEIIEGVHISVNDCLALYKEYKKKEIVNLQRINVEEWLTEPRSYLDGVYDFQDSTIDQAYIDKNRKIIEQQLLIAGIRLSAILQKTFN